MLPNLKQKFHHPFISIRHAVARQWNVFLLEPVSALANT
jgi:hypothetical protein